MIPCRVSIVVPCYNAARYIDDAIASLRAQTYDALEILAVDDGSTDGTQACLERHAATDSRIRVFAQSNAGPSAARNTAIRRLTGEYICFLDADDAFLPHKVERQLRFLHEHPEIDLVFSDYYISDSHLNLIGLTVPRVQTTDTYEAFALRNPFPPLAPMFRRGLLDAAGEFDESLRMAEDWDFWLRCAKVGAFGYLPGPLAIYRSHEAQAHLSLDELFLAGKRVLRKHLFRDRAFYERALASWYAVHAKELWAASRRWDTARFLALSAMHKRIARVLQRLPGLSFLALGFLARQRIR